MNTSSESNSSFAGKTRKSFLLIAGSWPTRIYLLLVAISAVYLLVVNSNQHAPDTSFAGVWIILLTLPWSLIAALLFPGSGGGSVAIFAVTIAVGALVNAMIFTRLSRNRQSSTL